MPSHIANSAHETRKLITAEFTGATGSEILNVAVVWFIVDRIGYNGGYLIALTLLSAIVFGTFGAPLMRRFGHLTKAISLNAIRACAAIGIFIVIFASWQPWIVVVLAMLISAVRPHIDSAVIGIVTALPLEPNKRSTANALVDGTYRMARIVGPAVTTVALWSQTFLPLLGAFLFAAASYMFSRVLKLDPLDEDAAQPMMLSKGRGRAQERRHRGTIVLFFTSQAVNAGAWYAGVIFALAVIIDSDAVIGGDIGLYGTAILWYGIGNLVGSFLGRYVILITTDLLALSAGRMLAGVGYLGLFASGGYEYVWVWTFLIALATPPCDLAFLRFGQKHYSATSVSDIYRTKMICEYSGMLLALLIAPSIIANSSALHVLILCGSALLFVAIIILGFFVTSGLRDRIRN